MVAGREPIQIVEIHQDFCTRTYGSAPCVATLTGGTPTGVRKCFNTRQTCQDPTNYVAGDLVLKFVKPVTSAPKDDLYIPSLVSVSTAPTKLNVGGGSRSKGPLGNRASATVMFMDHPFPDRAVDKYLSGRLDGTAQTDESGYDPFDRGTFWTKWITRNPFYTNRRLVIREGYTDQAPAAMNTREYLIDQITGPNSSGSVKIVAKDPLRLAEDERAQAPVLSPGELNADITAVATTLTVAGAVLADYPATGTLRADDELMTYTGRTILDGIITFTGVTRATDNTTADTHDLETQVQSCLRYTDADVWDIAEELLTDYAGIPASFLDTTGWAAEGALWLHQFSVSAVVAHPTGVSELLSELMEQALFYMWWDERTQKVLLRAVRPDTETPVSVTDRDHIIEDSMSVKEEPEQRITQVWVYWAIKSPVHHVDDPDSFRRIRIRADLEAETAVKHGDSRIRKVFARWIQTRGQAINLTARILGRYGVSPKIVQLELDAKDRDLWTADLINVTTRLITDDTGQALETLFQVISAEEHVPGHRVKYTLQKSEFQGINFAFWMSNTAPIFTLATDQEKKQGLWWSDASGEMSDGTAGYNWQ